VTGIRPDGILEIQRSVDFAIVVYADVTVVLRDPVLLEQGSVLVEDGGELFIL
jgi:hypothetical protein